MHGSRANFSNPISTAVFFAAFCHMLLQLVCMTGIAVKQVIIKQKQKNINEIDTIKLV